MNGNRRSPSSTYSPGVSRRFGFVCVCVRVLESRRVDQLTKLRAPRRLRNCTSARPRPAPLHALVREVGAEDDDARVAYSQVDVDLRGVQ